MKASALEMLEGIVPCSGAVFYSVDSRGAAVDHVFRNVDGRRNESYLDHFHQLDPFHPRRFEDRRLPLVTLDDVGGLSAYARSRYCVEFMAPLGVLHELELHLRDGGRIVGGVSLLRGGERGFEPPEVGLLRRVHAFLEQAFAAGRAAARRSSGPTPADGYGLTAREAEVVRLVCEGATNVEVGRALFIGLPTVKTHLRHAFEKAGVRSRTELVARLGPHPFG